MHVNLKITGRVQGVFFRKHAQLKADELHVFGYAKNQPDGSVYIEAEGDQANVTKFIEWCDEGSPDARIDDVQIEKDSHKDYMDFKIEY